MFRKSRALRRNSAWMVAGMVAGAVLLSCGDDSDEPVDPQDNQPPEFRAVPVGSAPTVVEKATIQLTANAKDPEGAALTFAWSQVSPAAPTGVFSTPAAANTAWKAPKVTATTPFKLRLTVSDGKSQITGDVDLSITDDGQPNAAPVFGGISVASTAIAGDTLDLVASATDADGDALSFTWSQTLPASQGVFTDATKANAKWRSPAISATTGFTLQVSVTDGEATTTQTRVVSVTIPSFANDIYQDVFINNCSGCHAAGGSGGLDLVSSGAAGARINLVGVAAAASTGCSPATQRVVASQPDNSVLVKRIEGTCTAEDRMPQSNPSFFDQNPGLVTRIRSWILNGALNN